jgi:HAD superfamily hydrolase (TIGR01662 family)
VLREYENLPQDSGLFTQDCHGEDVEGQSPRVTTVLFDAGGTLVHVDYGFIQKELRRVGVTVTRRRIREAEGASKAAIDRRMQTATPDTDDTRRQPYFAALLGQLGIAPALTAQLLDTIETAHRRENLWRTMLPSTPGVLTRLRERGLTLGVVSNADGRITSILERCGIAQFFQVIVDSHDVGVEKPDPRIFDFALRKVQARPEHTLYIGDIYSIDVVGAERAGLQPILLDSVGYYSATPCKKITHLRALSTTPLFSPNH